jgi:hypothetical protein
MEETKNDVGCTYITEEDGRVKEKRGGEEWCTERPSEGSKT